MNTANQTQRNSLVISGLTKRGSDKLRERLERVLSKSKSITLHEIDGDAMSLEEIGKSQCNMLLKHFAKGHAISNITASRMYGITSLHRRLSDLKNEGYVIRDEWVKHNKKRYKRYWMDQPVVIKSSNK